MVIDPVIVSPRAYSIQMNPKWSPNPKCSPKSGYRPTSVRTYHTIVTKRYRPGKEGKRRVE